MDYIAVSLIALILVVLAPVYVSWRLARAAFRAARGERPSGRESLMLAMLVGFGTFVLGAMPGHPPSLFPKPLLAALFVSPGISSISLVSSVYVGAIVLGGLVGAATATRRGESVRWRWLPPVGILVAYATLQLALVAPHRWHHDAKYSAKSGRVVDSEGRGVAGALVLLTGPNIDGVRFAAPMLTDREHAVLGRSFSAATTTDLDGNFLFPAIEEHLELGLADLFVNDFDRIPGPQWTVSVLAADLRLRDTDRQLPAVSARPDADSLRIEDLVVDTVPPTDRGFLPAGVVHTDRDGQLRVLPELKWAVDGRWVPRSGDRGTTHLHRAACESPPEVPVYVTQRANIAQAHASSLDSTRAPKLTAGDVCRELSVRPVSAERPRDSANHGVATAVPPQASDRSSRAGAPQLAIRERRIVMPPATSGSSTREGGSPRAQGQHGLTSGPAPDGTTGGAPRDGQTGLPLESVGGVVRRNTRTRDGHDLVVEERTHLVPRRRGGWSVDSVRIGPAPQPSVAVIHGRPLRVGDPVPDGGVIDSIRADRVVVVYEGEFHTIRVGAD